MSDDTSLINEDPNRLIPLDCMVEMEKEGAIAKLHDHYYVTVGNMGSIQNMRRFGRQIAEDLREVGVDGVILTAT
jgi:glycine reductase